jgi:hypothetical protein
LFTGVVAEVLQQDLDPAQEGHDACGITKAADAATKACPVETVEVANDFRAETL